MEIDLEVPTGEDNRLDRRLNVNVDSGDGQDIIHDEGNDGSSPTGSEHVGENLSPNVDKVGSPQADVINKVVNTFEPQKGLEFESKEAAYSFYRDYARSVGFGITIKASRRSKKSGKFIDIKIACSRFGNKRDSSTSVNSRSCPKTDCKASLHIKRKQDGKWSIYSFVKEHNHEICPNDFYIALRGRNKQSGNATLDQRKGLQLALDCGDVQVMLDSFMHMQDENPNFFYALDLDKEKCLRNIFWIDAKARHDYSYFCDVIFFDRTYLRLKYKVPFVPIIGVNHHAQFMLFGCGLIGEETVSSWIWLMKAWLRSVGGQVPKTVFIDQEKIMKEAITEVFTNVRHCFCLWHILSKIPENLRHIIQQHEDFMTKFNKCIYRSWTDEQFEKRWRKMVDRFNLKEDAWVQSLYEDRRMWVPTYMRDVFLGGISTSERSRSVTSFFDKYMNSESTFQEFIEQYKSYLLDRYEEEAKADFETRQKEPSLKSQSPFEKQMSKIYTQAIFENFQAEVLAASACHIKKEGAENEDLVNFKVDDLEEHQSFVVAWNENDFGVCSCRSFEYRGFVCRHVMVVLHMCGVFNIPSPYILRRWTKDAKISENLSEVSPNQLHYRVQRFNDLCKRAVKLGQEGCLSQETFDIVIPALEEALKHCVGVNNSVRSLLEPNPMATHHGFLDIDEENHGHVMAKTSNKKKNFRKRKVHSEVEVMNVRMQDNSQQEQLNSRIHTFDNSFVHRSDIHGMEHLGSRTQQTMDAYYDAQQTAQVVGQINSLSPIRDGYYGNQLGLQTLGQLNPTPTRVVHYGTQQSMQGLLQGQISFRGSLHGCFDIQENLQDMEHTVSSTQFPSIPSKHMHDKRLSQ